MRNTASDTAERATNSTGLKLLARAGLIAYGVMHLLIGWLALQIAWSGSAGKSADSSGALKTLASQPLGKPLLWLAAIGFVALALWQTSEAIWGQRQSDKIKRIRKQVTRGARAIIYAALALSAASIARGSGSSSSKSQKQTTAGVLDLPGGEFLVVVAGLVIIGVGIAHVVKGFKKSFLDDMEISSLSAATRRTVERLGESGYIAKGVALAVMGGLLAFATVSAGREKAGLDGAMHTIAGQPFGKLLLTAVAAGFLAFGAFAIMQSRYRRM